MIYGVAVLVAVVAGLVGYFLVRRARSPSSKSFDQNVREFRAELDSVLHDEVTHAPSEFQSEEEWLSRRTPPGSPEKAWTFCCRQFQDMIGHAGKRGYAVIAMEDSSQQPADIFFLQMRQKDAVQALTGAAGANVADSDISDLAIQYCPWCGKNLDRYYRGAPVPRHPELKLAVKGDLE